MSRIFRSTGIVAASTLASRLLGLTRDILMAALFSATGSTDAFYVAFRIPNIARRFLAEGVLTVSFIPVYTDYLVTRGRRDAFELAGRILTFMVLLASAVTALGVVLSPQIVRLLAMGFVDPSQVGITVVMTRIMFPYLFFVSMLAFCMGILNSHGRFFAPAFAPFVLNLGIIAGILALSPYLEEPLYGVAIGVIAGGFLQIIFQIPYLMKTGFRMKCSLDLNHPGMRNMLRLAVPGIFSMGIQQINTLVVMLLGSYLPPGSITYIYYSDRLHELVLGVFVVSIGNVILPELSALRADGEHRKLMEVYRSAVKSALLVALPAATALAVIGLPVVSVLFMHNKFGAREADMTYRALLCASFGIPAIAVVRITNPVFYALHDSKPPFYAAMASLIVNAGSGFLLMQTDLRHAGLTLAVSIAATVHMFIIVVLLARRAGTIGINDISRTALKCVISSVFMGLVVGLVAAPVDWKADPFMRRLLRLAAAVISGGGAYCALCWLMGVAEMRHIVNKIVKRTSRRSRMMQGHAAGVPGEGANRTLKTKP